MGNKAQFKNYGVFTRWSVPLAERLRQKQAAKPRRLEESTSDCKFVGTHSVPHSRPARECLTPVRSER